MAQKKKKLISLLNLGEEVQQEFTPRLNFKCANEEQSYALDCINRSPVTFLIGSAGTGKSMIALYFALSEILQGKYEKLYITKSMVQSCFEKDYGALPGQINERFSYQTHSVFALVDTLVGKDLKAKKYLSERIHIAPLGFLRGWTFSDCVVTVEESQNINFIGLKTILTRIGKNSKLIFNADLGQIDLPEGKSGLYEVIQKLEGMDGVSIAKFTDQFIVRHPLIAEILRRLK